MLRLPRMTINVTYEVVFGLLDRGRQRFLESWMALATMGVP